MSLVRFLEVPQKPLNRVAFFLISQFSKDNFVILKVKKITLFFIILLLCLNVRAQGNLKTHSKFGFKLGSGMQTITGCPIIHKPRIAFMGGFWVKLNIGKKWAMQAELFNIGKGTGLGLQQSKTGDYWLNLNYFEAPILFQFCKKNVYLEFGPSLAVLINTGEYTKGWLLPYQTDQYPISNKDISFNLGTGYKINDKWQIGLRITHSLLPVRKQLPATSHQVYNRGIIFSISRQINLKSLKSN